MNKKFYGSITREIAKRINEEDNPTKLFGTEIKYQRLSKTKSLKYVAFDICSISYLSKIENNKIVSNRYYLEELAKRVGITPKMVETLFDLKDMLSKSVFAILDDNNQIIEANYKKCSGLTNYRCKLIELIYHLSTKNMTKLDMLFEELFSLITTFSSNDIKVFTTLYSIYSFLSGDFDEALDNLDVLGELEINADLKLLSMLYKFYCHIAKNDVFVYKYYQQIISFCLDNGFTSILEKANYYMSLYYLRNGLYNEFKNIKKLIKNSKKISYLLSFYYFLEGNLNELSKYSENNIGKYYYLAKNDKRQLRGIVDEIFINYYDLDISPLFIKYNSLENVEAMEEFIAHDVMDYLKYIDDGFLKLYFFKQSIKIFTRRKSRLFFEYAEKIMGY